MKNTLFNREFNKIKQKTFDIHTLDVDGFCEKVVGYTTKGDEEKTSALLELDTLLYTMIGIESTLTEKRETKKKSRVIYRAIKSYNKTLGDSFLQHMDPDK
jgi:hypothetical protein